MIVFVCNNSAGYFCDVFTTLNAAKESFQISYSRVHGKQIEFVDTSTKTKVYLVHRQLIGEPVTGAELERVRVGTIEYVTANDQPTHL
jgi:hypothetical protein